MPIRIADYPELKLLCWSMPGATTLEPEVAHAIYTRNWRYIYVNHLTTDEIELIERLEAQFGRIPIRPNPQHVNLFPRPPFIS